MRAPRAARQTSAPEAREGAIFDSGNDVLPRSECCAAE